MAYKLVVRYHTNSVRENAERLEAQFCYWSTAAAIQTCINLYILPVEALTTA